jgi:hypothetical protein
MTSTASVKNPRLMNGNWDRKKELPPSDAPFQNERFELHEAFRFAALIMAAQACLTAYVSLRYARPIKHAARTNLWFGPLSFRYL